MPAQFKRFDVRHKITSPQDLMIQLLKWADKVSDPTKFDHHVHTEPQTAAMKQMNCYFLITSWSEKI